MRERGRERETEAGGRHSPLISFLVRCTTLLPPHSYSAFDEILENYDLYKVEIIGDAYYVVGGCPGVLSNRQHASDVIDAALALQRILPRIVQDADVPMRVGIHSGPVTAAVVGKQDPRYHLFGSTVSYAEKMESTGLPGKVQISAASYEYVRDVSRYKFELFWMQFWYQKYFSFYILENTLRHFYQIVKNDQFLKFSHFLKLKPS